MKKSLFLMLFAVCALAASAAKVTYSNGVLTFTENTDAGDVKMVFQKCMQNKLFTFYNIYLNNKLVNSAATSDNIGPFLAGGAWMGGNHNTPQGGSKPSAYTREVNVTVDGNELTSGTVNDAKVVTIDVRNEIFYTDDKKFADEYFTYRVSGNSIEVWGRHEFQYPNTMNVARYYGAQSMFPATELLLPGTKNAQWKKLASYSSYENGVKKSECPGFSTCVERCSNGYQTILKYREGMGDGSFVSSTANIFLNCNYGGATGKSYHVMMWDHNVKKGDITNWHALYTWFTEPVEDTFRSGANSPVFVYPSCIDGEYINITVDGNGKSDEPVSGIEDVIVDGETSAFAYSTEGAVIVTDEAPDAVCVDLSGKVIARGFGTFACPAGVYIVSNGHGRSVKLVVR